MSLLVYGVLVLIAFSIGMIPFMLGLLVVVPVLFASWLISYQDIFERRISPHRLNHPFGTARGGSVPRAAAAVADIPVRRLRVLPKSLPAISASTCPLAARTRPSPRLPAVARGARAASIEKKSPVAADQPEASARLAVLRGPSAAWMPQSSLQGRIYGVSAQDSQRGTGRGQNPPARRVAITPAPAKDRRGCRRCARCPR